MDRLVIVTKPTRLEELVRQHLTEGAARFSLESRGQAIEPYLREDIAYREALTLIQSQIPNDLPSTTVRREDVPNFLFRDKDLIVACGPDGLFANIAKYIADQPVITVNPDPANVAGTLMLFPPTAVGKLIQAVQSGTYRVERLPLVKAVIDNERTVWGVNDIFIGRRDHISARYELVFDGEKERQSSSGIIVSTGIGSTGWISSIVAMLDGLTDSSENELSSLPRTTDDELVFVVREPFRTPVTGTSLVSGRIDPDAPLTVISEMPEGGCVFSDGIVEKASEWNAGSSVVVSVGDRYVSRVVR